MPHADVEEVGIPVIDITTSSPETAQQILHAASTYGFLFIKNNGTDIPPQDIQDMFNLSEKFFKSPTEVKEECSIHTAQSGKNHGYLSMHTETLDPAKQKKGDFKEGFNIGDFVDGKANQPLPAPLKEEQDRIGHFQHQCHILCDKVLQLVAIALGILPSEGGKDWFSYRHDLSKGMSGSILRLLYYPSISIPSGKTDIRAGAHSDYGSVTLLFQLPGQPGLEILTPNNTWSPVPVNPTSLPTPPILVNIGDLLSYWTNGLLKSTVHRVIFPNPTSASTPASDTAEKSEHAGNSEERYSIVYFCHPLDDARLEPVPSEQVEGFASKEGEDQKLKVGYGGGAGEKVLTARDHLNRRLAATYGGLKS